MPTYIANYVSRRGRIANERVDAIDVSMVDDLIKQRGGFVIKINEKNEGRYKNHRLRVKRKGLLMALEAVALLLESGAKIDVAMRSSVSRVPQGKLRYMMAFIARRIEDSGQVGDAFGQFSRVFPDSVLNMIKAHEKAGTLVKGLIESCEYYRKMEIIRGDLAKGLFVPIIGLLAGIGSFGVLFGYTLPKFKSFITDMIPYDSLPLLSRVFFSISDFVTSHPAFVILAGVLVPVFAWRACMVSIVQMLIFKLASRTPVLGPALMASALARFCTTYATLTSVGFQSVDTLEMSSKVCGNALVGSAVDRVRQHLLDNRVATIGDAFQKEKTFPNEFVTAVSMGENNLLSIFGKLGNFYSREATNRINIAISALEPAMMILLGLFAATAGLSVFLPIVGLVTTLSGGH